MNSAALETASFPLLSDPVDAAPSNTWFCRIPIIGWHVAYMRQLANEGKLVSQAVERGPVPESEWEGHVYSLAIRERLERIVIEGAYPEGSTFHPLDPFELMIVLRYGDLNEVEIMGDIEKCFGIRFDDMLLERLIKEQMPFVEFIQYLEQCAQRTPDGGA